jgi:hypothetical protein
MRRGALSGQRRSVPARHLQLFALPKIGPVLAFTPLPSFILEQGQDAQSEYLFNTKTIRHMFCKTCGIESFAYGQMPDGTPMAAVNVNCLDGVDPREIAKQAYHYDGRAK